MKYRKTKKQLSHEEANQIFMKCQQAMTTETENVQYWTQRQGKKLEPLDSFILFSDKFTPEQAIKNSEERIIYFYDKMDDMRRFFQEGKNLLKIY